MLLPLAIASCGGDDKDEPSATSNDPEGTILVNVSRGDGIEILGIYICVDEDYNLFQVGNGWSYGGGFSELTSGKLSIVGPIKNIGNISANENSVNNKTWVGSAAAKIGYGYIFQKYTRKVIENGDGTYKLDGDNYVFNWTHNFYAVYINSEITNTSGEVLGYEVKVRKLFDLTYESTVNRYK